MKCEICKKKQGLHQIEDKLLCDSCLHNRTFVCRICQKRIIHRYGLDFATVCKACYDKYEICNSCNAFIPKEKIISTYDDYYEETKNFCERCYQEMSRKCKGCGKVIHNHSMCPECYSDWEDKVLDYGYKPNLENKHFLYTKKDTTRPRLYFGIELELEFFNNNSTTVINKLNEDFGKFFFLKTDGSLNNGVEIVTHPTTYDYHMRKFPWRKLCAYLKEANVKPDSTCGLHIHISKKPLCAKGLNKKHNYSNIKKLDYFFQKHQDFIKELSGRTSSFAYFKESIDIKNLGKYTSHYSAINFVNRVSIEVRTFKSSNDYKDILLAIDFLNILIQYIQGVNLKHLYSINNFFDYATEYKDNCPYFYSYLTKYQCCVA